MTKPLEGNSSLTKKKLVTLKIIKRTNKSLSKKVVMEKILEGFKSLISFFNIYLPLHILRSS
ncbi:MAG: hypothetical protein A3J72_08010 [Nitrospirae bacterium RIFCSPHIGHO2_02_FULL_40_19]|nr:MAG: hypothetical protein A3J72_08010 [Nitrospirae bacterium RIFCSPHIGHO2_02_FULL_40_19]